MVVWVNLAMIIVWDIRVSTVFALICAVITYIYRRA